MDYKREESLLKFDNMYDKLYDEYNLDLDKMQKEIKSVNLKIIIIISICLVLYLFEPISKVFEESIFLICIFAVIFLKLSLKTKKQQFLEIYKKKIISKTIAIVNENLKYYPESREKEKDIRFSYKYAEFENIIDDFYMDDYIEGNIENELFAKISNIKVNKEKMNDKYEKNRPYFDGMYVVINGINQINESVKITSEGLKNFENIVELDNEEFEEFFDVFSENKILALQILTHDVMEEMINFYKQHKIKFEIMLKDKEIHLRFDTGEMFEPDFKNGLNKQLLYQYYAILNFVIEVTKNINKTMNQIEI